MSGFSGLEALGAVFLASAAVGFFSLYTMANPWRALGRRANGRREQRQSRESALAGNPVALLWFGADGLIEATSRARALLGLREAGELGGSSPFTAVREGGGELQRALKRSLAEGAAFRTVFETTDGRVLAAEGAPAGVEIAVSLHDQTTLWRRADEAERRAAAAERTVEKLRAAMDATGLVVWRRDGVGALAEPGYAALDPRAQKALMAASAELAPSRRTRIVIEGVKSEATDPEAAFEVVAAGDGLYAALDASPVLAAERAMGRLVQTISETFAHLKVGLMIFDAERRVTLFNPPVVELFSDQGPEQGRDHMDWLARRPSLREILDRMRRDRLLPEQANFSAWREALIARADVGAPAFDETWHLPDGRTLMAIFRPHGSGGLAFVVEDISEALALRRTNAAERAARHATTDLLEEGVAIFGADGRLRIANTAFRRIWNFGGDAPEPGAHVGDIIGHCESAAGPHDFWSEMKSAAVGGATARTAFAENLALKDGRLLSARVSPMPDGSALAVFSDITATEQVAAALEERNIVLEQAEEMRGALIDRISHQMRTPLNSIFGFGQLLETKRFGPLNTVQDDYVAGIVEGSTRLLEAIDGMADLASIGVDVPREPKVSLDPGAALREAAALADRRSGPKARIEIDLAAAPARVVGHRARLRQIMFNLCIDVISKTPETGVAAFAVKTCGADLLLECRHEPGPEAGELGLALTLVRRFVRLNDGEVRIEQDADGRRVVLCRIADVVETAATALPPPAPRKHA